MPAQKLMCRVTEEIELTGHGVSICQATRDTLTSVITFHYTLHVSFRNPPADQAHVHFVLYIEVSYLLKWQNFRKLELLQMRIWNIRSLPVLNESFVHLNVTVLGLWNTPFIRTNTTILLIEFNFTLPFY